MKITNSVYYLVGVRWVTFPVNVRHARNARQASKSVKMSRVFAKIAPNIGVPVRPFRVLSES